MTIRQDQHIIQIIDHGWISESGMTDASTYQSLLGLDSDGNLWISKVDESPTDVRWKLLKSYFSV